MNMDNAKDFLPLVQALAEGKVIQFKMNRGGVVGWEEMDQGQITFGFYDPAMYRIKPEPRDIWVNEWEPAGKVVFDSPEEAAEHAKRYGIGHVATRYREVIE